MPYQIQSIKKLALIFFVLFFFAAVLAVLLGWFWLKSGAYRSIASHSNVPQTVIIEKGWGAKEIGQQLERKNLIKNKYFFYFYLWKNSEKKAALQAGEYELAPNATVPRIVEKISSGEIKDKTIKLTIPEGFTSKKIIDRVASLKPEFSEDFSFYASCKCLGEENCQCDKFSDKFSFLKDIPRGVDMEGYLFPDTYFIEEEDTANTLMLKILNNFSKKLSGGLLENIQSQEKSLHEFITMASIIEREAKNQEDRRIVSGIFWQRLEDEHALQSCATLAYFLGVDKTQFSYDDTRIDSPYNTYINPGLPPGPICNPGLESIEASIYPKETDYYYFLSNLENGKMIFSEDILEHNRKKEENGL